MMEDIATYILAILTGGGLVKLLDILGNRRKTKAETEQIAADTVKIAAATEQMAAETKQVKVTTAAAEVDYYRKTSDGLVEQMLKLETAQAEAQKAHTAEIQVIRASQEAGLKQYEERAGSLHAKMALLETALERANAALDKANAALDKANETIGELRDEVKRGYDTITELRKEISQLLIKQIENKEG